jgi:RNA polymerase sigma-B factor
MAGQDDGRRWPEAAQRALAGAGAAGGSVERDRLVEIFRPAIRAMARQYRDSVSVGEAELVRAGGVGLLRAVDRFDPSMEAPLWAYAAWWVRGAMQQVVVEHPYPRALSKDDLRELERRRAERKPHDRESEPTDPAA